MNANFREGRGRLSNHGWTPMDTDILSLLKNERFPCASVCSVVASIRVYPRSSVVLLRLGGALEFLPDGLQLIGRGFFHEVRRQGC